MSTSSPQATASADLARTQAGLSMQLSDVALPELKSMLDVIRRGIGTGGEPQDVAGVFSGARDTLNTGYTSAGRNMQSLVGQQATQSGERFLPGQVSGFSGEYLRGLEQDRSQGLRNLQFQEASAGMSQYNTLLNLLGQGAGTGLNLGRGFVGNQAGAIGGMSQASPFGSALGGAAAGAGAGSAFGPYGAIAGGVLGGVGGYLSAG